MRIIMSIFALVSVWSLQAQAGEGGCGSLDFDRKNGWASNRIPERFVESWVLFPCSLERDSVVSRFTWIAVDRADDDWLGRADWAIWSAEEVEDGCADDNNAIVSEWDVSNHREPYVENGEPLFLFDHPVYEYSLDVDIDLPAGEYYFGLRNVINSGWSLVLTRDCDEDAEAYFFPCDFSCRCFIAPTGMCFAMAYDTQVPCASIQRMRTKVDCDRRRARAKLRTDLPAGTELTMTLSGEDPRTVTIDERGKGKARWKTVHEQNVFRIEACPTLRQQGPDCPP